MKATTTRNRALSIFLSLCMVLSLLPTTAFAADTHDHGHVDDDTSVITNQIQTNSENGPYDDIVIDGTEIIISADIEMLVNTETDVEPILDNPIEPILDTDEVNIIKATLNDTLSVDETIVVENTDNNIVTLNSSSSIDPDNVATWTQQQYQTTGSQGAITMFVDATLSPACRAHHNTNNAACETSMSFKYKAATNTEKGRVTAVCSACGASTYIEIPTISYSMFQLDSASSTLMASGSEYTKTNFEVTMVPKAAYQWIFGTDSITDVIRVTGPGSYPVSVSLSGTFVEADITWPTTLNIRARTDIIAGSIPNPDDATTWTQTQHQTAGSEGNVITMWYDRRNTTGSSGCQHTCSNANYQGSDSLEISYETASSTKDGKAIWSCTACGASTYIVLPKVETTMFELDPASADLLENGADYNTQHFTIIYKVRPEYQWHIGTNLTNNIDIVSPGNYSFRLEMGSGGVEGEVPYKTELPFDERLVIRPAVLEWNRTVENHVYDGHTSLLDAVDNFSYTDVLGNTVYPDVKIYPVYINSSGQITGDTSRLITDPVDVGMYLLTATLPQNEKGGYDAVWNIGTSDISSPIQTARLYSYYTDPENTDMKAISLTSFAFIFPGANPIFVNDSFDDIVFTGANSSLYNFTVTQGSSFDTSKPGETNALMNLTITYKTEGGAKTAYYNMPVTVMPRDVIAVPTPTGAGKTGTPLTDMLPSTVSVTAETIDGHGKTVTNVPVTWNTSSYDPTKEGKQTVTGSLNVYALDELSDEGITTITGEVTLVKTMLDVTAPRIQDFSKTYDGDSDPLLLPTMPTGVKSTSILYQGTTLGGKQYSSTTAPTDAGNYTATVSFTMAIDTVNLVGYNQLDPLTVDYIIKPFEVTVTGSVSDMTYDGTTTMYQNAGQFTYKDETGTTRLANVNIYRVYQSGNGLIADRTTALNNANAVGYYNIHVSLDGANANYKMSDASRTDYYAFIYPTANYIFVNDEPSDVTLNGGTSAYFDYDVTETSFDSSKPGTLTGVETTIYSIYNGRRNVVNTYDVDVEVRSRKITAVPSYSTTAGIGASLFDVFPQKVTVTAEALDGTKHVSDVPVTWNQDDYDMHYTGGVQTIRGTFDLTNIPELNDKGLTGMTADIGLGALNANKPTLTSFKKVYDGLSELFPMPVLTTGIDHAEFHYTGESFAGEAYDSTTAPINAGNYEVEIQYIMAEGYYELNNDKVSYTISKAKPDCPYPVLVETTDTTLTVEKVDGIMYRIGAGEWTTNNVFTGLSPMTEYTVSQYIPASADGNWTNSDIVSNNYTTGEHTATVPTFEKQSYVYTGQPQEYHLPQLTEGIDSLTIQNYNTEDGKAPVNVGNYKVIIIAAPKDGYNLNVTMYQADLEITKGQQEPPTFTTADITATMNTLSLPTVPGILYSMDGWVWQTSGTFTDLEPGQMYMLFAKYAETANLYESDYISLFGSTIDNAAGAGTAYAPPTETQVHKYDTNTHPYVTDGIILDSTAIAAVLISNYSGTRENGTRYNSSSAPYDAGQYTVTLTLVPQDGYILEHDKLTGALVIEPLPQTCPVPELANATSTSLNVKRVGQAMYSLDNVNWQDSTEFTGLTPNTTYTVYQYIPATTDGNHMASDVVSAEFTTLTQKVNPPLFKSQSYVYNGNAKHYVMPSIPVGVDTYDITYNTADGSEPINVGTYNVTITMTLLPGYSMDKLVHTSTLTITKGSQNAPDLTADDITVTDTTVTITAIPGAEYSINGGAAWQTSNEFTGLKNNTSYNIVARMAETDNLFASDTVVIPARTSVLLAEIDTHYKLPTDQTYTYDGTAKPFDMTGLLIDSSVIATYSTRNYTGTTLGGTSYSSTKAPTEAGVYTVTVRLVAVDGYSLDNNGTTSQSLSATLTINKAAQNMAVNPTATTVSTKAIILEPIRNAQYSIDGGTTWQTSNTFSDLEPETSYTIWQRYPEDDNHFASNITSATFTTGAMTSIEYTIDYVNETIVYDNTIIKVYVNPNTSIAIPNNGTIRPGNNIYMYLVDNGNGERGETETVALAPRGTAPDVEFDTNNETVNTTTAMEYSTDNGTTWKAAGNNLDVSDLLGHAILVRYAAVPDVAFASESVELDLSLPIIDTDHDGIPDDEDEDDNNDGIPDVEDPNHPGYLEPDDTDGDGIPDNIDPDVDGDHIVNEHDPDHDDYDGIGCIDKDNNHYCDTCNIKISDCADDDNDHNCDICTIPLSDCVNNDGDHVCDICGKPMTECVDEDKNHKCDICGDTVSECIDKNNNHYCDICGAQVSSHTDQNSNHKCDICDETISDCIDTDNNHFCDICGKKLTDCIDANDDEKCDICGTDMLRDTDGDGTPDINDTDVDGDGIPNEIDPDYDLDGDGKPNGEDDDDDNDGIPDIIDPDADPDGDGMANAGDPDDDNDGIPDKQDPDHPDYDEDGDGIPNKTDPDDDDDGLLDIHDPDHPDYQGPCADGDNDHHCDHCDKELSACEDTDNDHNCDICNKTMTVCKDDDHDHYCDICGDKMSDHVDNNNNNICDICNQKINDCVDNNHDHICDNHGETLTDCEDADNDHHCDTCLKKLSDCVDGNDDDFCDICGGDMRLDSDGDGIVDALDPDDDNDGIPDITDTDDDGDGIPDYLDPDADSDHDGIPDPIDPDDNNDGVLDVDDPTHPEYVGQGPKDTDGDGTPDYLDTDDDNDGILDVHDPDNPDYVKDCEDNDNDHYCDTCPKGENTKLSDCIDEDNDNTCDICGKDMHPDTDGDGIPDIKDTDDDNDGTPDYLDPDADSDGDGIPDIEDEDDDNDGIPDVNDTDHPAFDSDGDGIPDIEDTDDNNDGIPDILDPDADSDHDGIPDIEDEDANGNGIPDSEENTPPLNDSDNDGIPDIIDPDDDNDGVLDTEDPDADSDGDGIPDIEDDDANNNGMPDDEEPDMPLKDSDNDGIPDIKDTDDDNDGVPDYLDPDADSDNDGIPDIEDNDDDNDGIPDAEDTDHPAYDSDGDGIPDIIDPDDNNDGVLDTNDPTADSDHDGIPDNEDDDANGNGIPDADEDDAPLKDSDGDGIPDITDTDDDNDGIPDYLDPDADSDHDGIPDVNDNDDDNDGTPDATDPDHGSADSDGDGIPDITDTDDDNDGTPDYLDPDADSDHDGIPDVNDTDDDNDGIPDENDPDHPFATKQGIDIIVTNYAEGTATYVTPQGGWKTGVNRFTVTSPDACAVAHIHNGVVTKLEAHQWNATTWYFEADVVEGDEIAIMLIGDADLDGHITVTDMTRISQYLVDLYTFSKLNKIAADVDLNGFISVSDMTRISQSLVDLYEIFWAIPVQS